MDTLTYIRQFFAYLGLPPLSLVLTKKSRRSPSRLLMGFSSYPCVIGRTTIGQCPFLFTFERNEHLRRERVCKGIQSGLFHDQVKIAQGRVHDSERTLSQRGVTRQIDFDAI